MAGVVVDLRAGDLKKGCVVGMAKSESKALVSDSQKEAERRFTDDIYSLLSVIISEYPSVAAL